MELPSAAVETALQRPSKALTRGAPPEIAVIAATQLARQDPQEAADRFDELQSPNAEDRALAAGARMDPPVAVGERVRRDPGLAGPRRAAQR